MRAFKTTRLSAWLSGKGFSRRTRDGREPSSKNHTAYLLAATALTCFGCVEVGEEGDLSQEMREERVGEASAALTTTCSLGVSCAPVTTLSTTSGAAYRVNMTGYRRLDLFASVCNPTGWTLHLTDSPTANGYGGDGGTTDHHAEGYLLNNTFQFFSAWDLSRFLPGAKLTSSGAYPGGCKVVQMTAFHAAGSAESTFRFEGDDANPSSSQEVSTLYGMKIGYTACTSTTSPQRSIECDVNDASLSDQNYWYVGINRVVPGGRTGTGVAKACIVLNSDVALNPTSCL